MLGLRSNQEFLTLAHPLHVSLIVLRVAISALGSICHNVVVVYAIDLIFDLFEGIDWFLSSDGQICEVGPGRHVCLRSAHGKRQRCWQLGRIRVREKDETELEEIMRKVLEGSSGGDQAKRLQRTRK